jgi:hypothetical protein
MKGEHEIQKDEIFGDPAKIYQSLKILPFDNTTLAECSRMATLMKVFVFKSNYLCIFIGCQNQVVNISSMNCLHSTCYHGDHYVVHRISDQSRRRLV